MSSAIASPDPATGLPRKALFDPSDLAAIFGVARETVYIWTREGRLPPPLKIGKLYRWPRAEIERLIAERGTR